MVDDGLNGDMFGDFGEDAQEVTPQKLNSDKGEGEADKEAEGFGDFGELPNEQI